MEFPNDKFKPRKDNYSRARGGPTKFLYVSCSSCHEPAMIYQKDGPGTLRRYYSDRIVWPPRLVQEQSKVTAETVKQAGSLACSTADCGNVFAHPMVYEPENRPAYRAIPGSVHVDKNVAQAQNRQNN